MKEFHPEEQVNAVSMEPAYDGFAVRRTAIKLSQGPRIMVALPIGGKPLSTVLECPQCASRGEEHTKMEVQAGFQPQGMVHVNFMLQHMNWLPPLNVTMGYMFKSGMLSGEARNVMTLEALQMPTVDYIFYVDDDMIIPPMGLYTLYNWMERHPEWGAVSGVYTTRVDPPEPLIYTEHGRGAAWDFEMGPGAAPKQIMGAGAGCLLARTDAIRSWMDANPGIPVWADSTESTASGRVTWGHDVRFVRNLTEAGWPCYVVGEVLCKHFDIRTNRMFSVPNDAPGFRERNLNTEVYWDGVYGAEGFASWRKYEQMFSHIVRRLRESNAYEVLELGCGPGILGQRITATFPCAWTGLDLSPVAVAQAKARYLDARVGDVRNLTVDDFSGQNTVIATELMEHLTWEDARNLLSKLNAKTGMVKQIIFSTPWECMSPADVPEHMVFVDQEWLDAACTVLSNYVLLSSEQVDEHHRVHVWERKE